MKVKYFIEKGFTIENEINEWLENNKDIKIKDIKFEYVSEYDESAALIIYEECELEFRRF